MGIAGFVFYLSGFVGKMFWWIVLFAIRGILVFERFASYRYTLGNSEMADQEQYKVEKILKDFKNLDNAKELFSELNYDIARDRLG